MNILVIHNKYKEKGGEDNSFAIEVKMLREHGQNVETLLFDNADLNSKLSLIKLTYKLFYNFESAAIIRKKIDEFKPDIIHVHNFFYVISPSVFYVAAKKNVPIVFTVRNYRLICVGAYLLRNNCICELCVKNKFPIHGLRYKCHSNSRIKSTQLTLMIGFHKIVNTWRHRINKYIVLTDFAKRKLLFSSLNLAPDQIVVKPNFCTDFGFTNGEERQDFFLFIGRLSDEKGIDILLKSFEIKPYKLKIIGTGVYGKAVSDLSIKYPHIEYLGFRKNEFIIDQLKKCKALIFPSKWYEGMPRTILEAFSTGTPVISTDLDNINEIVINGFNGFHFNNGDAQSLAKMIQYFNEHSDLKLIYENARKTFEG